MPRVGALVKPVRPPYTWRLGVVEEVLADGRFKVRAHVAPSGACEGSAHVSRPDELAEVPRADVEGALVTVRARIQRDQELARQIEAALGAA
jgi:hypothetical protein